MSLMTDSKIIHEANEEQEFQQNPQYFHRNVVPHQIYSDINLLSGQVNTFLKKFKHPNFMPNKSNPKNKSPLCNQMKVNQKSQIDQIASHTQNFIDGLTQINNIRKLSQSKTINAKPQPNQSQISLSKQFGSLNSKTEQILTKKSIPFHQSSDSKSFKNVQFAEKRSLKSSQDRYYRTVGLPIKDFQQSRYTTNKFQKFSTQSPNVQSLNNQFENFDDRVTVVNQTINGKRKFYKQRQEKDLKSERVTKKQSPSKLTKKKLLEKILNLENTVMQLKFQKYQTQKQKHEQKRNIFYSPAQSRPNKQPILSQKLEISNEKSNHSLRKRDQSNFIEQPRSFSQRVRQIANKDSHYAPIQVTQLNNKNGFSSIQRKNDFKIIQDKKVSLKQWVDQVW